MLIGIHFLLTYSCNFECDHCFLYCSPRSCGTFTSKQIKDTLDEAVKIGSIENIYFEGGEPFLYYPLMIKGIKLAKERGFKTGVVTNCYWAQTKEDAMIWLKNLVELGVSFISISDDTFHHGEVENNPAKNAQAALKELGTFGITLSIEKPSLNNAEESTLRKGGALLKGRAADKLIGEIPQKNWRSWEDMKTCPHEDLRDPSRVHIDSFGNVHLCQGLSMGSIWETPLSKLVANYKAEEHEICKHIIEGGPAQLTEYFRVNHNEKYIDECHLCYSTRKALIERFPEFLTPHQVYGLD